MAIPLVPLFAGAVIGSLVTYLYKDEKVRSGITRKAGEMSEKVKDTAGNVSEKVASGVGGLREKVSWKSADTPEAELPSTEEAENEELVVSTELNNSVDLDLEDKPDDK